MSEDRPTFTVSNEKTIEGYRAIGVAVYELYTDGSMTLFNNFNAGTTAADMAAAVAYAEKYARIMNGGMAF